MAKPEQAFSKEEKAAMRALAAERRKKFTPAEHAAEVQDKIKAMEPSDKKIAEKIHKLVMQLAPDLQPKTMYGMPAYYKDGKAFMFLQDKAKFKARYFLIGFTDVANLDKGGIWPISYAVATWNAEVEKQVTTLIKRAIKGTK